LIELEGERVDGVVGDAVVLGQVESRIEFCTGAVKDGVGNANSRLGRTQIGVRGEGCGDDRVALSSWDAWITGFRAAGAVSVLCAYLVFG
jgi:hypothetical protein